MTKKDREKYSFDNVLDSLRRGHELDFSYKQYLYSIHCHFPDSWYITLLEPHFTVSSSSIEELFGSIDFSGKKIDEIWDDIEIRTIY